MSALTLLLREPRLEARALLDGSDAHARARLHLACIGGAAAAFGAAVGAFRGGEQVLFAATKLPLALLLALSVTVPAAHAIFSTLGTPRPFARVASLVLAANARAALVMMALTPVLALTILLEFDYHDVALASAGVYALGLAASVAVLAATRDGSARADFALVLVAGVQVIVTMQSAWMLRPWLVRPSTDVVLLRHQEETAFGSVSMTLDSATGVYDPVRSMQRAAERGDSSP